MTQTIVNNNSDAFVDVRLAGVFYEATSTSDTTRTCSYTTFEVPMGMTLVLSDADKYIRSREVDVGTFTSVTEQPDNCSGKGGEGVSDGSEGGSGGGD